jgi:hypothetical protein
MERFQPTGNYKKTGFKSVVSGLVPWTVEGFLQDCGLKVKVYFDVRTGTADFISCT